MYGCMLSSAVCDSETEDCGSKVAAPFFASFILLAGLVMVNLFIAVILDNFRFVRDVVSVWSRTRELSQGVAMQQTTGQLARRFLWAADSRVGQDMGEVRSERASSHASGESLDGLDGFGGLPESNAWNRINSRT